MRIDTEFVLLRHKFLLLAQNQDCDGDCVRDYNLLDSALQAPYASFGGEEFFQQNKKKQQDWLQV